MTKAAYAAVFASPRRLTTGNFVVVTTPSAAGIARLGLAISRRYATTAVERNRVKRLVRESFREVQPALGAFDIVVMLRSATADVPAATLRAALASVWARLPAAESPPRPDRA